jgi:hypothetical protein
MASTTQRASLTAQAELRSAPANRLQGQCACGGHAAGGECERCREKRATKGGAVQRQATAAAGEPRKEGEAPLIVHEVLHAPGVPLDAETRAFFEPRLGRDFSDVRAHYGARAAASAAAVDARAYTVGRDVVFGAGQYDAAGGAGRVLMAHELAHVAQQRHRAPLPDRLPIGEAHGAAEIEARRIAVEVMQGHSATAPQPRGLALFRQPAQPAAAASVVDTLPPTPTFAQMWREYEQLRFDRRDAEALGKVDALIGVMMGDDALNHGGELALWLVGRGEWARARQALKAVETAWWMQWITNGKKIPLESLGGFGTFGPGVLITEAERQAASGQHDRVRELLGLAYLFLQMQVTLATDKRFEELARINALPTEVAEGLTLFRLFSYSNTRSTLASMRRVMGFYSTQQRQALVAGRTTESARFAQLDRALRASLRDQVLTGEGHQVIVLEATRGADRRRGEGYFLEGERGAREFVTPLPGTPRPDELGKHPAYSLSMEVAFATLGGQEDFLTEIYQQPQIRTAFGNRPIDMNSLGTRLQVWRHMYAAYQAAPTPGCGSALCSLLRLMERYLKAFTAHTDYNIRDFGVSYLDGQAPEDLLGRTLRDCGVYAVTVAYEVYRTARGGSTRFNVDFQLYHTLEHAMLAIMDRATGEHYVVSNDQVTGPKRGNVSDTVASAYSSLMGRTNTFTPAGRTGTLSTSMGDAAFRSNVWANYQTGARLGLRTEVPTGPEDARTDDQRRTDTYARYYRDLERYDHFATAADARIDALRDALAGKTAAEHTTIVSSALPELTRLGLGMAFVVDRYTQKGPSATVGLYQGLNTPMEQLALFQTARTTHPLARLAQALLYAEKVGLTLSNEQRALVQGIRNAPLPSLAGDIGAYEAAGKPSSF